MKFGLTQKELKLITDLVVTPLEKLDAQVYCYGSRARGDHQKFSDVDLMVESRTDLSQTVNQIKEELTKSNFPYKVDLVQLIDFAEAYKETYERDKVELKNL